MADLWLVQQRFKGIFLHLFDFIVEKVVISMRWGDLDVTVIEIGAVIDDFIDI